MTDIVEEILNTGSYLSKPEYIERFSAEQADLSFRFRKFELLQSYSFLGETNFISFQEHRFLDFACGIQQFYRNNYESSVHANEKGIIRSRLRFVTRPITDYVKFQYYSYLVWEKLGYKISFFEEDKLLFEKIRDFIIFDERVIFLLDFTEDTFRGVWECRDKTKIFSLIEWYDQIASQSIDFHKLMEPDEEIIRYLGGFDII